MNAKLLFKAVFTLVLLLLLILMGLNNKQSVSFSLPPLLKSSVSQPAAIMYFAFFAVGLLTGVVWTSGNGGKKSSGSSSSSKPAKKDK